MNHKEKGSASMLVTLKNGKIEVLHGSDGITIFKSKVKEGTWASIWKALEAGKLEDRK
jgi:hypothetical protein